MCSDTLTFHSVLPASPSQDTGPPGLLIYCYIRMTPLRKCKFNNSLGVSGNQGFTSVFQAVLMGTRGPSFPFRYFLLK